MGDECRVMGKGFEWGCWVSLASRNPSRLLTNIELLATASDLPLGRGEDTDGLPSICLSARGRRLVRLHE